MEFDASLLLQVADHAEKVPRLRIAARAEHANEALGRRVRRFAQLLKADRRLDVVAQDRLPGVHIPGKHRLNAFAQQLVRETATGRKPNLI